MSRTVLLLPLLLALPACSGSPAAQVESCQPIANMDWAHVRPDDKVKIEHATEDYCAVLAGKSPVHAKPDPTFRKPPNGSTRRYAGDGYTVTRVRNARFLGGAGVGFQGAVLRFSAELGAGEEHEISSVTAFKLPPIP